MTLVIALVSVKGGVGKTTTAVNLAGLAAASGLRTLVWDLDPQGAASYALGFDKKGRGASRHVTRRRPRLADAVFSTPTDGLDLIPADISLRTLDLALAQRKGPRRRVGEALATVVDDYDAVFVDTAAGITLANESALRAAQVYLSPIVPSPLGIRAFDQVARHVAETKKAPGQLLGFLSMVDRRKRTHREIAERCERERRDVLRTAVPVAADIEAAPRRGAPFPGTRRRSRSAIAYRNLWTDVQTATLGQLIDLTVTEDRPVRSRH